VSDAGLHDDCIIIKAIHNQLHNVNPATGLNDNERVSVPSPAVNGLLTSTLGCLLSVDSVVTDADEDFLRPATAAVTTAAVPNIVRRFVGDCCTSVQQANTVMHVIFILFHFTLYCVYFTSAKQVF